MSGAAQPHTQLTRAEATMILRWGHHRRDGDTDPPRGHRHINAASPNTLRSSAARAHPLHRRP